jgi:hypothetical protein
MSGMPLTRRRFLRLVGGGVAASAGALAVPELLSATPVWAAVPAPKDGIQRIGRAYLRLRPRENQVKVLRRKLAASGIRGDGRAQLAASATRIADDFAKDRIVTLDGWVLSVTEARLAALDLLTSP